MMDWTSGIASAFLPWNAASIVAATGAKREPSRLADRPGFGDQQSGSREVTTPYGLDSHTVQKERELVERADVTGELNLPDGQAPARVVPESFVRHRGDKAPPEYLFLGDAWAGKGARGPPQQRCSDGRSVGAQQRKTVQHQVDQTRRVRWRGEGPGGAGDLKQVAGARQISGEECRLPRVDERLAGQVEVERLEALGRLQQQRGSVAAQAGGERDPPAQQVRPGGLKLVERPGLRQGDEVACLAERAGLQAGLCRGQRALGAAHRVGRQVRRAFQERRSGGQPAAGLCPARGARKLRGDILVGFRRGLGQVPGPPVRVSGRVGHPGQRGMCAAPRPLRGRVIGRRADQRMPEPHPRMPRHQPLGLCGHARLPTGPQLPGRLRHQRGIPGRVGRRHRQQRLGIYWQGPHPGQVQLLQPPPEPQRPAQRHRPRQLLRGQLAGQLHQRQRIPRHPGHHLGAHPPIYPGAGRRSQQLTRRPGRQPAEHQLRQPGQRRRLPLPLPDGEQHAHPVGVQAAGDESEHLHRHLIQPLRVIDQAQHRLPGRRVGQQRQRRQPDQEPVRWRAVHQPERRLQRLPLRPGQPIQPAQKRHQQLVQPGEPQPHLRLDPGHPGQLHVNSLPGRPLQQHRLADARLPPQHQRPTQPVPERRQHSLQCGSLRSPVQQLANRSVLPPWPRRASRPGPTQSAGRRTPIIAHMPPGNQQVPASEGPAGKRAKPFIRG